MKKYPFTPEGITALQTWLNALPPAHFDAEIAAMQADFEQWSVNHLDLEPHQTQFYLSLSETAKKNLAYLVTLAASYKRTVSLVQEGDTEEPPEDKLFKPKSTLAVTSHNGGDYEVDGELIIDVTYIS